MIINLLDYFEREVAKQPNKIAIKEVKRELSFYELSELAKKYATLIKYSCDGVIRKPVAVFLDKQIESIVADVAILYAGNAYMNLDVKSPQQRIANILQLIQPELIITNQKYIDLLNTIWPNEKIINLDAFDFDEIHYSQKQIDKTLSAIIDTDPLCIINTSGSTGVPKGVVLNHRSFIDFTEWAIEETGITENEVIGSLSPLVFDIYSFELCMMMSLGNQIVIVPEGFSAFPVKLLQLLEQNLVSFIFWVPTIMVNIANLNLLEKIPLSYLKSVWFAGEVFPTKQLNYWRKYLGNAKFINLYGPIEITLDCTYYIIDRELQDDEPIPIGRACKNTDVFILNEDNKLCGINEEGELCVRGTSLAMGYYNNPEKTAVAFVQNPLNNSYPELIYRTGDIALINENEEIIFKGRKDSLIKHSGYRIELGEIEHVIINTLNLVENGCAVYDFDKKQIKFYFESDKTITVKEFREALSKVFPKYMFPNKFIQLEELPRNTNGKIDRLKLREVHD